MFLKNIIVLLCAVYFLQKSSTTKNKEIAEASETTEEISTADVGDECQKKYQELFNKYATNEKGVISATELQKLIFEEFNGFLTVRDTNTYVSLLHRKKKNTITFEIFQKMKPIIDVLSKRVRSDEDEEVVENSTIPIKTVMDELANDFGILFLDNNEIFELFTLIELNETEPVQLRKFKLVKKMLAASLQLTKFVEGFCLFDNNNDCVIDKREVVKLFEVLSPREANTSSVKKMIAAHDKNDDGVLDLYEYMLFITQSVDEDEMFRSIFQTPRITRDKLKSFVFKLYSLELTDEILDEIDPNHKDSISYRDVEHYFIKN